MNRELRILVGYAPGNVMNRPDAPAAALFVGIRAKVEMSPGAAGADPETMPAVFLAERLEPQDAGQEPLGGLQGALPQTYRVQTKDLLVRRYRAPIPRCELPLVARLDERDRQSMRIGEG